jgi:hypothetical protein
MKRRIDGSQSPLRQVMSEAGAFPYRPIDSLAAAQSDPNGIAVLEGDDGGQIYVVCPASRIMCSADVLQQLLADIDQIEWPGNEPDMRRVYFESKPVGGTVPGGMGGACVREGAWIHPVLIKKGFSEAILAVLSGQRQRIA